MSSVDKQNLTNRMRISVSHFAGASNANSIKKERKKKIFNVLLKVFKIIVYAFFLGIGLYGCFQNMANH